MGMREDVLVIRRLNDDLRQKGQDGRVLMTQGIQALPQEVIQKVIDAVKAFDDFTPDNDPHGEHDFGSVRIGENAIFWKIDYYDESRMFGSDDPSNPAKTTRVLTLMLADEY